MEILLVNYVGTFLTAKEADKSSDTQWLRTVLKSGTQSDKVASLTMLTQVGLNLNLISSLFLLSSDLM